MRVRFSREVLHEPAAWDDLDRIVHYFLENRHRWDPLDADTIANAPWLASDQGGRAGRRSREVLEKSATSNAWTPATRAHSITVVIELRTASSDRLSPADAIRCLSAPVYVVVENSESDGAFLNAVVYAYSRRVLTDAHTDGWLQLEHAGGNGEIEKRVREIQARAAGPSRVYVLADSDAGYPTEQSATVDKLRAFCEAEHIPFTILRKRKIENYIPLDAFQLPSKEMAKLAAYAALTPMQRDCYDLKRGFQASHPECAEIEALYRGAPPTLSML